jgi:capsular polysaccharide export protein
VIPSNDSPALDAVGFSLWKRPYCRPYLNTLTNNINWLNQAKPMSHCVTWGSGEALKHLYLTSLTRMEDGFLHSAGLGSDLTPPMSQILDSKGIYFDARTPSTLTQLLNEHDFTEQELTRAESLRLSICKAGLTKYNLGRTYVSWQKPIDKKVILVPGQVADDASVKFGTAHIKTIEDLLLKVRELNPEAFIVYKPHPDVLSGNRKGLLESSQLYDKIDAKADIISLIEVVDEVHTLSSLAGFDALLRMKKVVVYGMPFYSGWGLTQDIVVDIPFRQRTVSLQALVTASLILYPLYWDWQTNQLSTPEAVVARLALTANRPKTKTSRILNLARNLFRWFRNVYLYYFNKPYLETAK